MSRHGAFTCMVYCGFAVAGSCRWKARQPDNLRSRHSGPSKRFFCEPSRVGICLTLVALRNRSEDFVMNFFAVCLARARFPAIRCQLRWIANFYKPIILPCCSKVLGYSNFRMYAAMCFLLHVQQGTISSAREPAKNSQTKTAWSGLSPNQCRASTNYCYFPRLS